MLDGVAASMRSTLSRRVDALQGDAVGLRDRVVLWSLGSGSVLSLLAWHFVHPWAAFVVGLLSLAVAGVAYRIEKPRIDLDHPEAWKSTEEDPAQHVER